MNQPQHPICTHKRTKSLETEGDLGKQGRNARRLETHHRSGPSFGTPEAIHFSNGRGCEFLKNEAVKEELTDINTKAIGRIKIGSNKISLREDLAQEKMLFSQEPSDAMFEMGNVELIELEKSMIQCPSCLHYVFKGTILCRCGKHIRPDLDMIRRIKAAFEILKAPYVFDYCKGLQTRS